MELILKRIAKRKGYTIGRLSIIDNSQFLPCKRPSAERTIDNLPTESNKADANNCQLSIINYQLPKYFCDTLEPTWRDYQGGAYKMKGKSAIPEGRYAVVISYSPKFKQWLPILLGVPKFSGIRIHAGNSAKDTEGCILVGENREVGRVLESKKWLNRLKQKIVEAKDRGEPVWITIQ